MKKRADNNGESDIGLASRLADVEAALERVERKLATVEIEANSSKRRLNAAVDFYEHRIDQIYRQVVNELGRALGTQKIVADTEADIDLKLTRIFGEALRDTPVTIADHVKSALTDEIRPGPIASPLTLAGFRLDRSRCRETTRGIEIRPKSEVGAGIAVFGPYRRLKPGSYRLSAAIQIPDKIEAIGAIQSGNVELDVYSATLNRVVGQTKSKAYRFLTGKGISVNFDWPPEASEGPVEFRLHQRSNLKLNLTAFELGLTTD